MITGASQADVALLMIPSDGNFTAAIARGNHKAGEVQGQTRQHALLINLLGVKQLVIGINKMDCDVAGYKEERYKEIKEEMERMLIRVGWPKPFITKSVAFLPISGWMGDNLITKSTKMPWWKGADVVVEGQKEPIHIDTLLDVLEKQVQVPHRNSDVIARTPISGIYKIKGIGDVLTGRVEQGKVNAGEENVFLPTHTTGTPCEGKVFSIEMHHKTVPTAGPGDNCGFNIKGLKKENMPHVGDVMVLKSDKTINRCQSFTVQVRVLDHPGELKVGYCPIAFVRTGRSAVRMTKIDWKVGKETGGQKLEDPISLKANEMAQAVFAPQAPFVVDVFKNCEGLGRVALMEGASVIMLGKCVKVEFKKD
jgi:elongation factor 1-alpha